MANLLPAGVNAVTDAINRVTGDSHVRLAMLVGSNMESGWNAGAVGDQGSSFGPFQIHLPAHPGVTAQQAEDPDFAAKYMLGAYQSGVSQVSASMWSTNPALAAATAAYYAERPLNMYPASTYQSAYAATVKVLGGANLGPSGGGGGSDGSGGGVQTASFLGFDVGTILKPLQDIMNTGYCFALIAGGVVVVGVGFYWMLKGSAPSIAVPNITVKVPEAKTQRIVRDEPRPEGGGRERTAPRYANATRLIPPATVTRRTATGATRPRPTVSAGTKREIERV